MNRIKNFVCSIPWEANLLAIAAAVVLLIKILAANELPEIFRNAYEVGVVFEGLLGSILASYVFFLIVVHLKERRDIASISTFINAWRDRIVGDCCSTVQAVGKATDMQLDLASLTLEDVEKAFAKIDPQASAPLMIKLNDYATWMGYLKYNNDRTRRWINKLFTQLKYVPAELTAKVLDIDNCTYFYVVDVAASHAMKNTDASFLASNFYDYCELCRKLKDLPQL